MAKELFTLDGPLCALENAGARQTDVCPNCGRGRRIQIANLQVSLVCQPRHVWLSDGNAVLLDQKAKATMSGINSEGIGFRHVKGAWRPDLPWADRTVPDLMQLVATSHISVSSQSVELDGCSCGAVRSISFEPLVVLDPESAVGVWCLAENPEVLVFDDAVRDALICADPDLEFLRVWREDEYISPATPSGGIDWSDV